MKSSSWPPLRRASCPRSNGRSPATDRGAPESWKGRRRTRRRERAARLGAVRAGRRESSEAVLGDGDGHVVRTDHELFDGGSCRVRVVLASAVDPETFAVWRDETYAARVEAERTWKLQAVLHHQQSGRSRSDARSVGRRFEAHRRHRRQLDRRRRAPRALSPRSRWRGLGCGEGRRAKTSHYCQRFVSFSRTLTPTISSLPDLVTRIGPLVFHYGPTVYLLSSGPREDEAGMAELRTIRAERQPLFESIGASLKHEIAVGTIRPVGPLPGERELSQMLEVSRTTLRRAIAGLIQEGVLVHRHGAGTFVQRSAAACRAAAVAPDELYRGHAAQGARGLLEGHRARRVPADAGGVDDARHRPQRDGFPSGAPQARRRRADGDRASRRADALSRPRRPGRRVRSTPRSRRRAIARCARCSG